MNPPALPLLDGDTLLIDNSSMELHTTCPRAAQYGICRRLRTSAERVPLKFGGIAHKVLETRYRMGTPMYEQTSAVEAAMIGVAEDEYSRWTPPEDDYRNKDRMIDLIHRYGLQYQFEPWEILTFGGKPFIEVPFAVPLCDLKVDAELWVQLVTREPNGTLRFLGQPVLRHVGTIRVMWMGKIDLGYEYNSGLYILDHKTSSMATNMAEFEISHQFYGYTFATEQILSRTVSGVVINRIVVRKPTRTGEAFTFERKLIPIQRGLVNEWRNDCIHIIADFIEMIRRGYFPKHTSWCVGKFGTCQFHKVCSLDDNDQREILLTSGEYEESLWNPLRSE